MGSYITDGENEIGVALTDSWAGVWTVDTPYIEVIRRDFWDRFLADADGEPVRITVRELDEPSTCIWCYGCGDFIQHGTDDGGCECEERGHDPEEDREPMRPLVVENGRLELTPFN